ncbi:MAG: peptide-methionine (S)-S-oxide reductase MsrA [Cyanobacteria bacterium]|nr:peptide-methionine (S)-S-oxide reductase MsrA [Cyanobacteriota bacterium]MDA1170580.1 peptide-methionine (S)-S-oxide reductase MsrA [Cyanobacteriota bacterium]
MADSNKHFVLGSSIDAPAGPNEAEASFGCGCFWGAEKGFWRLPGVVSTAVGYAGGSAPSPSYNAVCGGRTGHAEVVRVIWNTEVIDFSDLLKLFWECHDPTQGDRQGNDRGSQYRSVIYTPSEELDGLAKASKNSYQALLSEKGFPDITTEIKLDQIFYAAEPEHQQYLAKPGSRPYCSAQPTKIKLGPFAGCHYLLPETVWSNYDWSVNHCVLRGDNSPITV